jgi:hypothetical protein
VTDSHSPAISEHTSILHVGDWLTLNGVLRHSEGSENVPRNRVTLPLLEG